MSRAPATPPGEPEAPGAGPPARRPRLVRALHVLGWTALFYGLTYGVARLAEWASGR